MGSWNRRPELGSEKVGVVTGKAPVRVFADLVSDEVDLLFAENLGQCLVKCFPKRSAVSLSSPFKTALEKDRVTTHVTHLNK